MTEVHIDAALRTGELTESELREVVVFVTHYAGWSRGARLNDQVEELIDRVRQTRSGRGGRSG
jgi:4-carboxymuconolactone decarboxylase